MYDKISNMSYSVPKFPKLVGEVNITLHNTVTGETEIISDHNVVTNAVKDIFTFNCGGISDRECLGAISDWFGGILCLSQALDSDVNSYDIPSIASCRITAHGGDEDMNTSTWYEDDNTLGTYVSSEVVTTDTSIKRVWEWDEDRGNGIISSIALCHPTIGNYSIGTTTQRSGNKIIHKSLIHTLCSSDHKKYPESITEISGTIIFAVDNNISYAFKVSANGELTLYETPIIVDTTNLQGNSLIPLSAYTKEYNVSIDHEFLGNNACMYYYDFKNQKLYLFSVYTTSPTYDLQPRDLTVDVINLADHTVNSTTTTINMPNGYLWTIQSRDYNPYYSYAPFEYPIPAVVINNMVYFPTCSETYEPTPDACIRINLANLSYVDTIPLYYDGSYVFSALAAYGVIVRGNYAIRPSDDGWSGLLFTESGIYCYGNFADGTSGNYLYTSPANNRVAVGCPVYAEWSYSGGHEPLPAIFTDILYLATKYNLPRTVAKTSSHTMRIEYTISISED